MSRAAAIFGAILWAGCPSAQHPGIGGDDDDGGPCDPGSADCPASCSDPRTVTDFELCTETTVDSYTVVARYIGSGKLALDSSTVTLNGQPYDAASAFDAGSQTFTIKASGLAPSKYSFLFRMQDDSGAALRPVFVPMWIGPGIRYGGFTWRDATIYQILTDRFLDGNTGNNIDNSVGDLARVDDFRSRWQGGDFAGITQKIKDGYFESMGVNALWISSPILDSHNSQPSVQLTDNRRFASYHSYHPVATGYSYANQEGYGNPIEPAFGTADELKALVQAAHDRGIRVLPDFVANHIHKEGKLYAEHPDWFFPYNPCDNRWDVARIGCWFTTDTPDFDYGGHQDAIDAVVDHALWMIQEFNFDGFRADALKHMDDRFVRALKAGVVAEVETTVKDHSKTDEPTVFYMVGESLGGWARYHVREDMVQGQVDEQYYNMTKGAWLNFGTSVRALADFAIGNDTAYLTPQENNGGIGGYPGAVMGNFFGNHDQVRALTEAGGLYERLRLAQVFLLTSPKNIPMIYQGDDIGTFGGPDPDNRKMQRFTGLSADEAKTLANIRKAGLLREQHPALRRGTRSHEVVEDWYWVYKLTYEDDVVYVALNRDNTKQWSPPPGYSDGLGNCSGGQVPILTPCIFVKQ
jgi:neopullulanase